MQKLSFQEIIFPGKLCENCSTEKRSNDWQRVRDFINIEPFHFPSLVGKIRSTLKLKKQYRVPYNK